MTQNVVSGHEQNILTPNPTLPYPTPPYPPDSKKCAIRRLNRRRMKQSAES